MAAGNSPVSLISEDIVEDVRRFNMNSEALNSALISSNSSYHVVVITGPQSSGKSTLFNKAFGLEFRMMNSTITSQTTQGIDMTVSNRYSRVFLDMEGGDSFERFTNQASHVERMILGFGSTVADVLVYNIWMNEIGSRTSQIEPISKIISHYLSSCGEKRKILFTIRDVPSDEDKENLKLNLSEMFRKAVQKAVNENNLRTNGQNLRQVEETKRPPNKYNLRSESLSLKQVEETKSAASKDNLPRKALNPKQVEELFYLDFAFIGRYDKKNNRFISADLENFRGKIDSLLQEIDLRSAFILSELFKKSWDSISKEEIINTYKICSNAKYVKQIREELICSCQSLSEIIAKGGKYENHLKQIKQEFTLRINKTKDECLKQALNNIYDEEIVQQEIVLERKVFEYLVKQYFEKTTGKTNLLSDYISMYRELDKLDKDRERISKNNYKDFLHKLAFEKELYFKTIVQSIRKIYNDSYFKIKQLRETYYKWKESQNINKEVKELETSCYRALSTIRHILVYIGFCAIPSASAVAAYFGLISVPYALLIGGVGIGLGIWALSWSREDVWKSLANKARNKIMSAPEYQEMIGNYQLLVSNIL